MFTASKPAAGSAIVAGWDSERVSYANQGLGLKPKGIRPDKPRCYGVVAKFTIRNGGSVRAFKSPVRHKVCPTPKW